MKMVKDSPIKNYNFDSYLDTEFLDKNYGENLELCIRMFDTFLSTIEEDMSKLSDANKNQDHNEILSIAHKIKNNFIYVGHGELNKMMIELEHEARKQSSTVAEMITLIMEKYEKLILVLQSESNKLKVFVSN